MRIWGLLLQPYSFNYLHSKDIFKPKRFKLREEIPNKVLKLVPVLEQVLTLVAPWELILPLAKSQFFLIQWEQKTFRIETQK